MTKTSMKTYLTIVLITVVAFTLAVSGCYEDNEQDLYIKIPSASDTTHVSYSKDVLPIFISNCALSGCHTGTTPAANISLDNYAGIVDANVLTIRAAINYQGGSPMPPPPASQLTSSQLKIIDNWINQGLPFN